VIEKKILSKKQAAKLIKKGDTVMISGFLTCGGPNEIVDELAIQGTDDLTLICNDTAFHLPKFNKTLGLAKLIVNKQVKKIITSHIGTNVETQRQMIEKETEICLVPQGTLIERIRAHGFGLGGILTPTGVGTEVEEGKKVIKVQGKKYLLEERLGGDIAIIKAKKADKAGNLVYNKSARNFAPIMATACPTVIAQVEEIVEIGEISPEQVVTPSIFIKYLVLEEGKNAIQTK